MKSHENTQSTYRHMKWRIVARSNFVNLLTSLANNYMVFLRARKSYRGLKGKRVHDFRFMTTVIDKLKYCRSVINGIGHICGISNEHEQRQRKVTVNDDLVTFSICLTLSPKGNNKVATLNSFINRKHVKNENPIAKTRSE